MIRRLAILTQYFAPEMGAPQSRLLEMAQGMQKRGWEVRVITAMPNYPTGKIFSKYRGKFSSDEEVKGLPVKRYWLYPSNSAKRLPRIASMLSFSLTSLFALRYLRKFKPDFLLVESPPLTLAWSALVLAKGLRARMVMNVSDLWPLTAKELGAISDGFVYRQALKLERYLYSKADICTGQSQEIVDHLTAHGARRPFLFRNGVDPSRFQARTETSSSGPYRIVYAGLLGVAQNILEICEAIDFASKNLEFHIFGNGTQRTEIASYILNHTGKGVILHDSVSREEIAALLPTFDGTIIPLTRNIYGAIPSKIYEAMAAGLPILFSGGGEGEKIIRQYDIGWTSAPGNMKELEANLDIFASDFENRRKVKNNAISTAHNVFNRDIQIGKLHEYLVQITKEKN